MLADPSRDGKPPILIVDDYPRIREGVANALLAERVFKLAGEAADGGETNGLSRCLKRDATDIDLQMPGLSGVDAILSSWMSARLQLAAPTAYGGDACADRVLRRALSVPVE